MTDNKKQKNRPMEPIKLVSPEEVFFADKSVKEWLDEKSGDSIEIEKFAAVRESDNTAVGAIGAIFVRNKISEEWSEIGGHIGYFVAPNERRKGYAKEMLRLCLAECKRRGITQLYITCDKDNIASAKTIIANGGILEKEIEFKGKTKQRYIVILKYGSYSNKTGTPMTDNKNLLKSVKRISIIGPSGSGKSTLAVKLGEVLKLPVHHIDCYFLQPNWQTIDKQLLATQIEDVAKNDKWIIEGNYKRTLANRFERSDLIIFLNLPFDFCIECVKGRHERKEKRMGLPSYLEITEERLPELLEKITAKGYYDSLHYFIEEYRQKIIEFNNREQVDEFVKSLMTN